MFIKHRSLTPTIVSSRFSNWSYHDLGNAFNVFAEKDKANGAATETKDGVNVLVAEDKVCTSATQWAKARKFGHLVVIYQLVFLCSLAITAIEPSTPISTATDHGERRSVLLDSIPYASFLVGMSVGWLVSVPIITLHHRRMPSLLTTACFALSQLAVGLSKGLILVSCFRASAGLFAGIVMALCQTMIQDMFAITRVSPYLFSMLLSGVASSFGPSYQYLMASKIHPRWVQLIIGFATFPALICLFLMFDTKVTPKDLAGPKFSMWSKIKTFIWLAIGRPVALFFTVPILVILGLSVGFSTAVVFALYRSLPSILLKAFTQTQLEVSLSCFTLAIGSVIGFLSLLIYNSARAKRASARARLSIDNENLEDSIASVDDSNSKTPSKPRRRRRRRASYHSIRWFWPILPLLIFLPLSLAFFGLSVTPGNVIFVPLGFLAIASASAYISLACAWLHIHEQASDEDMAPAIAIFMFFVLAVSVGVCVALEKALEILSLKQVFGIFAGVTAFCTIVVLVVSLCLRRAK